MGDEKRAQARKLWEESGGKLLLKDIATQLTVPEGTLRTWKKRDGWGCNVAVLRNDETQRERQRKRQARTNRRAAETVEANKKLTEREKEFCIAFVHAPNASQAAQLTGRYSTYDSARQAAFGMMQKPAVIEEIRRLKAIKRAALLADADDVIEMHIRIAFADISAFVEFGREMVPVMGPFGPIMVKDEVTKKKVPVTKMVNTVRFKEHTEVDGTVISEVKQGKDGASVKLADRQKSLDFLERYFELDPMSKHKKKYDNAKLELEKRQVKVQEEKLHSDNPDGSETGVVELAPVMEAGADGTERYMDAPAKAGNVSGAAGV